MKSFESDIKKYAEKTRLKAIEREMVRDRILSYMEYHPLKKESLKVPVLSTLQAHEFTYIRFNTLWIKVAGGVFALVLVVGVPFLAERSVPGDVLYLVKTGFNEGIRTQLASSPYEKVQLETKLMERRISEARLLASEGKLTEAVGAQIAEDVKGHAEAVQSGLAELRQNDADGAALAEIVFNSALEVQSAVLDESDNTSTSSVGSIIDVVNTMRDAVGSDVNPATPSYEGLLARIEIETTRAYELSEAVKKSATLEETADIARRLSDIDRSIVDAKKLKETDEAGAIAQMSDVLGTTQKLITFMTDIDVHQTVTLETLVPVIRTPEERIQAITATLDAMATSTAEVEKRLVLLEEKSVAEKVQFGLDQVKKLRVSVEEALTAQDLDGAESKLGEAEALALDLAKMTQDVQLEPAPVPDGENTASTTASTTTEEVIVPETGATTTPVDAVESAAD